MENKKTVVEEVSRASKEIINKNDPTSISRIEESLRIDKQEIEEGKYYIKKTILEEDVSEEVKVYHDNVRMERVEINKYIDTVPEIKNEGNTMIIPVVKEVLVIEKKLLLVEEIHVIKEKEEEIVNVNETLKKEQVEITKQVKHHI